MFLNAVNLLVRLPKLEFVRLLLAILLLFFYELRKWVENMNNILFSMMDTFE